MAVLHKEYHKFNKTIRLDDSKKESLIKSRNAVRKAIKSWFKNNKPDEIQPKFHSQGSMEMNTTINPIPETDGDGNELLKYDLDDGVYFIGEEDQRKGIETWHNWIFDAVDNHTNQPSIRKATCVRVVFADGHHIDLPIYFMEDESPELAHKIKRWLESDPKAFYKWFNDAATKNPQLRKNIRFLKAWKNYRETQNTNLKLPSGFELTILATNNLVVDDNDDVAFLKTIKAIKASLDEKFECIRPTTPEGEDVFADYSDTRKSDFLTRLDNLISACEKASAETNTKAACEYLRKQFGDRFPLGKDEDERDTSSSLSAGLSAAVITPKPYYSYE